MNLKLIRCGKVKLKRNQDSLLISGDGRCLKEDLHKALPLKAFDIMSIGKSIKAFLPGTVKHWAMVDGPANKWWAEHLKTDDGVPITPIRHTLGECSGFDVNWDDGEEDGASWYGSSALFATLIGLILGYKTIILAGCPMDKEGHWYFGEEHKGPDWREEDYQAWREFATLPQSKVVSSLSGFTKEILCH